MTGSEILDNAVNIAFDEGISFLEAFEKYKKMEGLELDNVFEMGDYPIPFEIFNEADWEICDNMEEYFIVYKDSDGQLCYSISAYDCENKLFDTEHGDKTLEEIKIVAKM